MLEARRVGTARVLADLAGVWEFMPAALAPAGQYLPGAGGDWRSIRVPANWYKEGVELQGAAWYRRRFDRPAEPAGKLARLVFDGVDYAADVWLNGHYLGFHEGYFQRFDFDVSAHLLDRDNVLVVRVDSPYEIPGPDGWSLHKRLVKGVFNHHDARPGGSWSPLQGQNANTGGIWAGVRLEASDAAALRAVTANGQWQPEPFVKLALTVLAPLAREATLTARLRRIDDGSAAAPPEVFSLTLAPGDTRLALEVPAPGVAAWWPAEMGTPQLYHLELVLESDGQVLDSVTETVGFRSIERDDSGIWRINGSRLFLRGTNYIGSQWLSELGAEDYRRDIGLLLDAHCNAVRVHAHVTGRDFYRLCDEIGLLVWQDAPLQWGYKDTPDCVDSVVRQIGEMITEYGGHPSIICWSLHNETPWDAPWMQYKYPNWKPGQNEEMDRRMLAAARAIETTRYVHPFSGTQEHPWFGWYSGEWTEFAKPFALSIATEFGAQALPCKDSLVKIFGADKLWPESEEEWALWRYHNFQPEETFGTFAKLERGPDIDSFIRTTQDYQAFVTQYAAECFRRQRYAPLGGCFHFLLNEPWPSINWGVVDYWRVPKAGYAALKRAFQPVLPSIEWTRKDFAAGEAPAARLWVINDCHRVHAGAVLSWRLLRGETVLAEDHLTADIEGDSGAVLADWRRDGLEPGAYRLCVTLTDADGLPLGDNEWAFAVG